MIKLPLSLMSPSGRAGRLSILIFHRVLPQPDPLNPDEPDAASFEERMQWVREWFNVLPLAEAIERLGSNSLPARALAITFDDGYADNVEVAAPILQRLGLSATFFITTGYLDGGCMWNDRVIEALRVCPGDEIDLSELSLGRLPLADATQRRSAVLAAINGIKHLEPWRRQAATEAIVTACGSPAAPPLMMAAGQVRGLRALGMDVGGHTVTHPILTRLSPLVAREEIGAGKARLEEILGEKVPLFAYPNGVPGQDYALEHVRMARDCGFRAAVSTAWGAARASHDPFQLPRFTPWDRERTRFGLRMLANLGRRPLQLA
jgi:peptidoglycan/xylan/chitin deacetylase (PgdA/CDA1 family)